MLGWLSLRTSRALTGDSNATVSRAQSYLPLAHVALRVIFTLLAAAGILQAWGDVVGMTAAHEADLCCELGLRYNSLAIIDNYANGLENTEIDFGKFKDLVKSNQEKVNRLFARMLEILG